MTVEVKSKKNKKSGLNNSQSEEPKAKKIKEEKTIKVEDEQTDATKSPKTDKTIKAEDNKSDDKKTPTKENTIEGKDNQTNSIKKTPKRDKKKNKDAEEKEQNSDAEEKEENSDAIKKTPKKEKKKKVKQAKKTEATMNDKEKLKLIIKRRKQLAYEAEHEKKRLESAAKSLKYLNDYIHNRDTWKFCTIKQKWLVKHACDTDKVSDEIFADVCEYIKSMKGKVIELCRQSVLKTIKAHDEWQKEKEASGKTDAELVEEKGQQKMITNKMKGRAETVLQILPEFV